MRLSIRGAVVLCLSAVFSFVGTVKADLLFGASALQRPDITSQYVTVVYTAGAGSTGSLSVSGFPMSISFPLAVDPANTPWSITPARTMTLAATVDKVTGDPEAGGLLTISGNIPSSPVGSPPGAFSVANGPLLTATLNAVGWDPANYELQFLLHVSGGQLESAFGGAGAPLGVRLQWNGSHSFSGSFMQSFDNLSSSNAQTDTATVPEPVTAIFLLMGGSLLTLRRRRAV
ncbi:MAG: PEP-CTERM sorting domain-containing protein [Phycisphaerae bacterium]|nr:PEP-CTERM sorting domain-containing protein [Phycisphaerae bacterium]